MVCWFSNRVKSLGLRACWLSNRLVHNIQFLGMLVAAVVAVWWMLALG